LWAFIVAALALFGGMLAAVVVFGAEPKAARKAAHATAQPTVKSPRAATTVRVSEKEFKITLASTTLKAGQVTFDVKNVGTVPHDLVIAGTSDRTSTSRRGWTRRSWSPSWNGCQALCAKADSLRTLFFTL